MRVSALPMVAAFAAAPAFAQDLTEAEMLTLPRIIDALCVELVDAFNGCEYALVLASTSEPDRADLVILPNRLARDAGPPIAVLPNLAYAGGFFGQQPSLEPGPEGGLILHEEQIAMGRTPWMQSLELRYRDGAFIVAAFSYSSYDRPMGGGFGCDVNYLEHAWFVSADRVNPETGEVTYDVSDTGNLPDATPVLDDWRDRRDLPAVCRDALGAWFDAAPL